MTVVGSDGTVLADSNEDSATMENHASRPEIAAALQGRTGEARRVSQTEGSEQLYVAVPATVAGTAGAVRVSEEIASIDRVAARARRVGIILLVLALGLAAAIAAVVSRGLAEPIRELSAAAERMAAGDLGAEIPRPAGELGVLADSLGEVRRQIRLRIDELEAEQANMRSALDGFQDAVFLLHGDEIRFANAAACTLFRAPADGWRGRGVRDVGLPVSLAARIVDLLGREEPFSEDVPPEPTGRSLRLSTVPLNPVEGSARTLVVLSDITERVQLERMRRDFVANASHELKTPAAGIQLLAESAADAAADGDEAQAIVFARQIATESSRLQRLVRDLLDLSRLETTPSAESIANVREAVGNAMLGHQSAAAARGLYVRFDDSKMADQDAFVVADPTDLAVALDNLLDNAITYTEAGGVSVSIEATADTLRLRVEDTGIGMPEDELPRIFERFYRVDRARSRDSGGTGLGLALVRHAIERSGGTVAVESKPGSGTAFNLVFRRAL